MKRPVFVLIVTIVCLPMAGCGGCGGPSASALRRAGQRSGSSDNDDTTPVAAVVPVATKPVASNEKAAPAVGAAAPASVAAAPAPAIKEADKEAAPPAPS